MKDRPDKRYSTGAVLNGKEDLKREKTGYGKKVSAPATCTAEAWVITTPLVDQYHFSLHLLLSLSSRKCNKRAALEIKLTYLSYKG